MATKLFNETGEWPTTEEGWCEYFKELDRRYPETLRRFDGSSRLPKSPLHHDNRCEKCKRESNRSN